MSLYKSSVVRVLTVASVSMCVLSRAAFAASSCPEPKLAASLKRLEERAAHVGSQREQNASILEDRKSALGGATALTYVGTSLIAAEVAAVGAAVGAVGGIAVGLGASAGSGAAAALGNFFGSVVLGGGIGAAAGAGATFSVASRVGAASLDDAQNGINGETRKLEGSDLVDPSMVRAGVDKRIELFRQAHAAVAKIGADEEQKIEDQSHWYNDLGWGAKHEIEIMVAENQAHEDLYAMELKFLSQAHSEIRGICRIFDESQALGRDAGATGRATPSNPAPVQASNPSETTGTNQSNGAQVH